jgi:hypothetical protein
MLVLTGLGSVILVSVVIAFIERWTFLEAVYFCVITLSTVGFGDLTPKQPLSKMLSIALIFSSLILLAAALARMQQGVLKKYQSAVRRMVPESPFSRMLVSGGAVALVIWLSAAILHIYEGFSIVDAIYFTVQVITTGASVEYLSCNLSLFRS